MSTFISFKRDLFPDIPDTKFNRKNNDKSRVEMQQFIAKLLVLKMGAKRSISLLLYIPLDKIS
jgi:hypothetical protein